MHPPLSVVYFLMLPSSYWMNAHLVFSDISIQLTSRIITSDFFRSKSRAEIQLWFKVMVCISTQGNKTTLHHIFSIIQWSSFICYINLAINNWYMWSSYWNICYLVFFTWKSLMIYTFEESHQVVVIMLWLENISNILPELKCETR